ncbi:MAG: ABC transporter permease [Spirochaetaceae bacterium]|nr:ABC transporter permease [Spirochaetaceae bacterium]
MIEDFISALQNFARNKTRTLLSLLGVIIGVASVIVITSMGASSTQEIQDTFGTSGLDMISVGSGFMSRRGGGSSSLVFDESFRDELFGVVPNIKHIWYKNSVNATVSVDDTSSSINCAAIETGYLEAYNFQLESGTFFNVTDNEEGTQKIILNHATATSLFPKGDATGKHIILVSNNVSFGFEICGVLAEQSTGMENGAAFVPRGFYAKKISPNPAAASVIVQAVSSEKTPDLVTAITEYCTAKTGSSYSVNVSSMQTMIDQMSEITNSLSVMLAGIAAISLLVGGIGIMNIMIVTVTERRQEIGIRKALGASPADIKRQFLVESASITLIGGAIGIIAGVLISFAVEYVKGSSFIVNANACVIAFVFSMLVGIIFGLWPAARAAKLDPVQALSGE